MKILHRAKWIVPISSPPIENGGIITDGGIIHSIGPFPLLSRHIPSDMKVLDHQESILMPGFINAHCHLELSWMAGMMDKGLGFGHWLRRLMSIKSDESASISLKNIVQKAKHALEYMAKKGIVLVGDVCNNYKYIEHINDQQSSPLPLLHLFIEILHPFGKNLELPSSALNTNTNLLCSWSLSPHSVYTCSRKAISIIKKACDERMMPMTIHCCESPEEMTFCRKQEGPIADILLQRGRKIEDFFSSTDSPIKLLNETGVLDSRTICVHCTFAGEEDMELMGNQEAFACLCPKSNEYIHGSLPPAEKLFERVRNICIGTDSLASNENLSILSEVRVLYDNFHKIKPEFLIEAATLGGARALGQENRFGSLQPGRSARFIKIKGGPEDMSSLYDFICTEAEYAGIECISHE